ncbi:hypothetical protein, unlikely [Trypanosoma brucei brucei TREU927]|uniref:Uncharacterized protein n=1 Tax=Trypanosoma brucei brucei (strain 927/4 GUTat10.1) TaxID=185431 RepID=Q38F45_TRYB2|nr:hypothetical protein, unlikely [Trypanosoma brucei brucei TREU927]EAN76575.1 hypothetical protein, unlikely [Trypanosoma brucei brucei TREU927]
MYKSYQFYPLVFYLLLSGFSVVLIEHVWRCKEFFPPPFFSFFILCLDQYNLGCFPHVYFIWILGGMHFFSFFFFGLTLVFLIFWELCTAWVADLLTPTHARLLSLLPCFPVAWKGNEVGCTNFFFPPFHSYRSIFFFFAAGRCKRELWRYRVSFEKNCSWNGREEEEEGYLFVAAAVGTATGKWG